jgi:hypothetical protein
MASLSLTKSGPLSDTATFVSGGPGASGDTIDLKGFSLYVDSSVSLVLNDSSSSDGYVVVGPGCTLYITGLTGGVRVSGGNELEFKSSGSYHVG